MDELKRRRTGLAFATGTMLISGLAVFLNASGVRAFGDATAYTTAKNAFAALFLILLAVAARAWRSGATAPRLPRTRGGWTKLALIGIVGGSVPFILFFEGLARATASDAAFLHKTLVIWVAVLAVPLLGERLGGWHLGALALLIGGQLLLVGGVPQLAAGGGELMILIATLLWSGEVIVAKKVLAEVPPATVGLARMGVGSVVLIAWTVIARGPAALFVLTGQQLWWAVITGLILAGYVATWLAALSRARAVDVTAVLVGAAIITALLDGALRGAALTEALPGLVAIAGGVGLIAVAGARQHRSAAQTPART